MIPAPRIADIQMVVAAEFSLGFEDMTSPQRFRAVAHPRQLAMFLARSLTDRSLPEIGRMFGGRDHSTVVHAVRSVEFRLKTDEELAERARHITAILASTVDKRRRFGAV